MKGDSDPPEGQFLSLVPGCRLWCIPQLPVHLPRAGQTESDAACRPEGHPHPPSSPAGYLHLNIAQRKSVTAQFLKSDGSFGEFGYFLLIAEEIKSYYCKKIKKENYFFSILDFFKKVQRALKNLIFEYLQYS